MSPHLLPGLAAAGIILTLLVLMLRDGPSGRNGWIFPALLSLAFFIFSLVTVLKEGLFGFWPEHVDGFWGNQIWFDLLLAVGIGWFLMVPRAKALGMRLPLWMLFILSTGCIGVLAMLSRLLYLESRR